MVFFMKIPIMDDLASSGTATYVFYIAFDGVVGQSWNEFGSVW
jgi:hypothetical protein